MSYILEERGKLIASVYNFRCSVFGSPSWPRELGYLVPRRTLFRLSIAHEENIDSSISHRSNAQSTTGRCRKPAVSRTYCCVTHPFSFLSVLVCLSANQCVFPPLHGRQSTLLHGGAPTNTEVGSGSGSLSARSAQNGALPGQWKRDSCSSASVHPSLSTSLSTSGTTST